MNNKIQRLDSVDSGETNNTASSPKNPVDSTKQNFLKAVADCMNHTPNPTRPCIGERLDYNGSLEAYTRTLEQFPFDPRKK